MATPPLGGTGLRVQSGIDGKQVAGGEAMALFDWYKNFALAGEASWKPSLHPSVALLAGAGASCTRYGGTDPFTAFYAGGEIGLVVSTAQLVDGSCRP